MKKYREATYKSKCIIEMRCDICGRVTEHPAYWGKETYDIEETLVRIKTGKSYPKAGWGKSLEIDVCPDCFKEKLIPFIIKESSGRFEPIWEEWKH